MQSCTPVIERYLGEKEVKNISVDENAVGGKTKTGIIFRTEKIGNHKKTAPSCNYFIISATNWVQRKGETMETRQLEKDFLDMIAAHKRIVYKVCYIYAKDQDDLNDLFQETVLNLWKSFPRYRGDSKLTTWVYRIAMNTCITFLRRSNARPQTIPLTKDLTSHFAAEEGSADQLRELYKLINQLGKLERALILLWLEERSYQEMADILGISKNNVAVKLNRTKEKLKKMSNR